MTISLDVVGKTFPSPPSYVVGREKVREFASAVGSSNPLFFDVEVAKRAGYSDVVAPTTFAVVLQEQTLRQLIADEEVGLDFSRVVHGDQSFTYSRPIVAGDELCSTLTITAVKTLGVHQMITAESVVVDVEGEHVVTAVSTLVVRGE